MRIGVLFVVLSCAAFAQPAPSADTEKARTAFSAAQQLYQASRFADALKKFEEAQALKPHPVIVFNIARCQELLGQVPQSLKSYREYLRLSPGAADKDAVLAAIAVLEKKLPAPSSQQLVINAEPAACLVMVDGKRLGFAPVTAELAPGEHSLEVSAEGYETLKRKVTLAPQRTVELNVTLKALPRPVEVAEVKKPLPPPPPPAEDAPKKEPVLTPTQPPEEPLLTKPNEPPPRRRVFTWVAGGTAVVAAGVATSLGVGAMNNMNDLRNGTIHTHEDANAMAENATGLATGSNVVWGLAGTALVTAVVLFFVEGN